MIKQDKVLVSINMKNFGHYKDLGYKMEKFHIENKIKLLVNVEHVPKKSNYRITAICEICKSENDISFSKYYSNVEKNNKGYYSCFGCKNHVKEKTCLEKYGVKSYSMTDEFKVSESEKWKGVQKGSEKGKKTMMERYGVDSYFKTDLMRDKNREWMSSEEFRNKSKETLISRYGVDSYSKTDEFKKTLIDNKDIILEKIKKAFKEKYRNEYLSKTEYWKSIFTSKKHEILDKIKNTCIIRYGVDNVSKVSSVKIKSKLTKEYNGVIIPEKDLSEWHSYKRIVRNITKLNKKSLYESWNGYDYYDDEFIKGYFSYTHTHRFYPTIDHKVSVYYGYMNKIDPTIIGSIDNLCITKRFINSTKKSLVEDDFISKIKDI